MARKSINIERLVINAIKNLQDLQGSSPQEISNYLSQEYSVPSVKIKKHVQLALRRAVSYGILQQKSRNTFGYSKEFLEQIKNGNKNGEVVEPCPWMKYRFGRMKKSSGRRRKGRKSSRGRKKSKRRRRRRTKGRKKRRKRGTRSGRKKSGNNHAQRMRKTRKDTTDCLALLGGSGKISGRKKSRKSRKNSRSRSLSKI